ncbi:MAG: Gfo/Idh/MocA family oxidoreductase [Pseudomonadales bacterium]
MPRLSPLSGGGSLLDIGVHMMDLALYLMDNFTPVAVTGATYTKFGQRGLGEGGWGHSDREDLEFNVDDFATAIIKLEGGATLTLDVSWALHQEDIEKMNVQLYGTEAGASVYPPQIFRAGAKVNITSCKIPPPYPSMGTPPGSTILSTPSPGMNHLV